MAGRRRQGTAAATEQGHLLAGPFDDRIEPESGSRSARSGIGAARKVRRWFHLMMVQPPASIADRRSGERSSLWRTRSVRSGAITRNRTRSSSGSIRRVTAQQRLAEHRGPLDLEQEGDLPADVPDGVDLDQRVRRPDRSSRGRRASRGPRAGRRGAPRPSSAGLLALRQPDAHPESMTGVGQRGEQLRVLLAAAQQVVGRDEVVRGAGRARDSSSRQARTSVSSGRSCPVNIVAMRSKNAVSVKGPPSTAG